MLPHLQCVPLKECGTACCFSRCTTARSRVAVQHTPHSQGAPPGQTKNNFQVLDRRLLGTYLRLPVQHAKYVHGHAARGLQHQVSTRQRGSRAGERGAARRRVAPARLLCSRRPQLWRLATARPSGGRASAPVRARRRGSRRPCPSRHCGGRRRPRSLSSNRELSTRLMPRCVPTQPGHAVHVASAHRCQQRVQARSDICLSLD